MLLVALIILILLMFGSAPHWGLHKYGYGPSGLLGLLVIIALVLLLLR